MKITNNSVVSIAYQVKTDDGALVDESSTSTPLAYLHGHNSLIPGLENALEGRAVGDKFSVDVPADEAYGEYNDALVQLVPKDAFQGVETLEVGMRFVADTDAGAVPVEITEIDGDDIVVDGNHMLAGKDLSFAVEVVGLRAATEEEISHGHLHHGDGACGGHHDHDEPGACNGDGSCGCH